MTKKDANRTPTAPISLVLPDGRTPEDTNRNDLRRSFNPKVEGFDSLGTHRSIGAAANRSKTMLSCNEPREPDVDHAGARPTRMMSGDRPRLPPDSESPATIWPP